MTWKDGAVVGVTIYSGGATGGVLTSNNVRACSGGAEAWFTILNDGAVAGFTTCNDGAVPG